MLTPFDAMVAMAQTLLRARGEWHGPATAFADIDLAVNQCSDLLPDPSRERCEGVIAELKRRAGTKREDA